MSSENVEDKLARLLIRNGYNVQTGSDFPSTIDVLATKEDRLYLFEVKAYGTIDFSDLARMKSLESMWSERLKSDKRKTHSFIITKGEVTDEAKELSRDLRIDICSYSQLTTVIRKLKEK